MRVGWADCDPAGIAFTGRIPYWALEAIDVWWENCVGIDWYRLNVDRGVGSPFVHMTLDFRAPVTPRAALDCHVRLLAFGRSSLRHGVTGYQNDILCFEGQFVSTIVDSKAMKSRRPPGDLRKILIRLAPKDEE